MDVTPTAAATVVAPLARAQVAVWRPATGEWFMADLDDPTTAFTGLQWGLAGDVLVPADYDGDGVAEVAVWRPSDRTWYIHNPDGPPQIVQFGLAGDVPVPADYDGDGKAEIAVWRPGDRTWYVRTPDGGARALQFGAAGDVPVPANYRATLSPRQILALGQRRAAAIAQIARRPRYDVPFGRTPDEGRFPAFAASFTKLFPHDPQTGLPTPVGVAGYEQLLRGLRIDRPSSDFDSTALETLPLAPAPDGPSPRVLIDPRSSKALSIKGPDIASLRVSRLIYGREDEKRLLDEIGLGSEFSAAEMVEVYAMALLRNQPLGSYAGNPDAQLAAEALNSFGDQYVWGYQVPGGQPGAGIKPVTATTRPVTAGNLFRGVTPGDLAGDYLSVFLTFLRPPLFPAGCSPSVADLIDAGAYAELLSQQLLVPQGEDRDFGTTWANYVAIQNRRIPEPYPPPPAPRQPGFFRGLGPITTGRNLGEYVHVDNVYEHAIRAADILTGNRYRRSRNSPYTRDPAELNQPPRTPYYPNEGDGPTLGAPDAYALIGGVREVAERAAFTQKWLVARRARPEAMAALIDRLNGPEHRVQTPLSRRLLEATGAKTPVLRLLGRVRQWNAARNAARHGGEANLLLAQQFPEGSPAHPSWPSGHAVVVGAAVTVIKAIWDDRQPIVRPTRKAAGEGPEALTDAAGQPLTVGGELDKLASNIAFGRDWAGVHFRTDGEHGILLGEQVAIDYLRDHAREYREQLRDCPGFVLTRRTGQRVCIAPDGVTELPPEPVRRRPATLAFSAL